MLIGRPTKYGAGITLAGDYIDLRDLRETIHYFASDEGPLPPHHGEFVQGLAYDVRHAYQGDRRVETVDSQIANSTYFAVDIIWPIFLVQVAMLRAVASYIPTERTHQANLYRLEACVEHALNTLDTNISRQCCRWLHEFSPFPHDYLIDFVPYQSRLYITSSSTAEGRIPTLPDIMKDISSYSPKYRAYETNLRAIAEQQRCRPEDLFDFSEWPEFRW